MPGTNVTLKIPADGKPEGVEQKMTLAEMQKYVGGYIEMVRSNVPHRSLVVNEEGFLKGLPANFEATKFVRSGTLMAGGVIQGNALLVKS